MRARKKQTCANSNQPLCVVDRLRYFTTAPMFGARHPERGLMSPLSLVATSGAKQASCCVLTDLTLYYENATENVPTINDHRRLTIGTCHFDTESLAAE